MAMLERRFTEIRADGRLITGRMPYNERARLPFGYELFEPRSFGDVAGLDVLLNVQHVEGRLLARTGGGGLELRDSPEALDVAATLPNTREADDALELVRTGVLRGLSVEFRAVKELFEGRLRRIQRAALDGLGLVARPAYLGATVDVRSLAGQAVAVRQDGEGLTGQFFYDQDTVVSDRAAALPGLAEHRQRRGVRKQRAKPGSFTFAIEAPDREIQLLAGRNYDRPLASKLAGTLTLADTAESLAFRADRIPETTYTADLRAQMATGAAVFGVTPLFRIPPPDVVPNATEIIPEPGNPGVMIEVVNEAVLTALAIVTRPPRGNPGDVALRHRRRVWL